MNASDVVIVAATRSPIGSFCGAFSSLRGHQLGSEVIKSALSQANLQPSDVSEVILGQALQAGQGQNPARQASISAEIPITTPASSINMLCGSGLKAVANGYLTVLNEPQAIVVAGGQESMTQAPHVGHLRTPVKLGNFQMIDSMLHDGLTDVFHNVHMGVTAEKVAEKYDISRAEQDSFAAESQRRTGESIKMNVFTKEITPIKLTVKGQPVVIDKDEYPRPETTEQSLANLKPAFNKTSGTVTAGNASGINDGAAVVVLTSRQLASSRNIACRARIVGFAHGGVDPLLMGLGPIPAIQNLLKKVGWTSKDVDLFEINEAFASISVAVLKELGLDPSKVNVNGGAIALGHPIGASGCRVLVTLLHALEQRNANRGVAALCIGGGMGIAMAIERN